MPSTISAGTTAGTAIAIAGDTTGNLAFQTNGTTTAMTIDTSGNVSLGSGPATTSRLYLSTPSGDGTVNVSGDGTNYAVFRSQGASFYQLGSLTSIPMSFITNSSERMRISSTGVVTTPAQPAFLVTMPSTTIASNTILVFTEIQNNIGSYYNSSNGRFTAPVAGVYSISFGAISGTNATVYRTTLYRNGNTLLVNSNPDVAQIRLDCSSGIDFLQGAKTLNVYLNANDFLTIHFGADDASSYTNSTWTFFSGFLVG